MTKENLTVSEELKTLERWREQSIAEKSRDKSGTPYVFFEGPPTANGVPGIEAAPLTSSERKSLPPGSSDMVSGFGSDMPLNMALQQVVPQQYKISLSPDVNGAKHVSWRGDRPWPW